MRTRRAIRETEINHNEIQLLPLTECIGTYEGLETEKSHLTVVFSRDHHKLKIVFKADSAEANILKRKLKDDLIGQKIGIMKTGISERPIAIRKILNSR